MTNNSFTAFAVAFALLATTAPAHAVYISDLDVDVNLNYGSGQSLTGNIDFTYNPYFYTLNGIEHADYSGSSIPYNVSSASLSLNGTPLGGAIIGNTGYQWTQTYFPYGGGGLFGLEVNTSNIGNLSYVDFVGATSGSVTVVSEILATPLPASLPLFATAMLALVGFGAYQSRRAARG